MSGFLDRQTLAMITAGICVINGIFSPYLNIAIPITTALLPELFPKTAGWVLFFSSIMVATATLLTSGIPAALYERSVGRDPQDDVPGWIWLVGAAVLTLPALNIVTNL